jgi:hypothetical protein
MFTPQTSYTLDRWFAPPYSSPVGTSAWVKGPGEIRHRLLSPCQRFQNHNFLGYSEPLFNPRRKMKRHSKVPVRLSFLCLYIVSMVNPISSSKVANTETVLLVCCTLCELHLCTVVNINAFWCMALFGNPPILSTNPKIKPYFIYLGVFFLE